jgi:hypothetical protein
VSGVTRIDCPRWVLIRVLTILYSFSTLVTLGVLRFKPLLLLTRQCVKSSYGRVLVPVMVYPSGGLFGYAFDPGRHLGPELPIF